MNNVGRGQKSVPVFATTGETSKIILLVFISVHNSGYGTSILESREGLAEFSRIFTLDFLTLNCSSNTLRDCL